MCETACITIQKDHVVMDVRRAREPLIKSPLEIDGPKFCLWCGVKEELIKVRGGPLTKAKTKAPQTHAIVPNNLAFPCHFFMEMLSILKFPKLNYTLFIIKNLVFFSKNK